MLGQGASSILVALALGTMGIAAGIFMAPNNKLVLLHAPVDKQGVASGVYKTGLSIGSVIGIAIFPIVIMHTVMKRIAAEHITMEQARHSPEILAAGFHSAFVLAIFISVLALIFSILAKDKIE
jgi:MFS family permease